MTDVMKKPFNHRAFTAIGAALSGIALPFTGYANHMYALEPLPPTMARHAWMSAHNILGIMFVVFAGWHVILNRHALWKHLRGIAIRKVVSREALCAVSIVAFVAFVFISHAFHAGVR